MAILIDDDDSGVAQAAEVLLVVLFQQGSHEGCFRGGSEDVLRDFASLGVDSHTSCSLLDKGVDKSLWQINQELPYLRSFVEVFE